MDRAKLITWTALGGFAAIMQTTDTHASAVATAVGTDAEIADIQPDVLEENAPGGIVNLRDPAIDVDVELQRPPTVVEPAFRFREAGHVTAGVALRNRTSGTIHLRGVPLRSRVLKALLYWNYSDGRQPGPRSAPILLDGNVKSGVKTADNPDPCWGMAQNHSFRADVTDLVLRSAHPNQDYEVTVPFSRATSTTGQNPWHPIETQRVRLEGATLVVVYYHPDDTNGPLYIYDRLPNTMFFSYAAFELIHDPLDGPALFSMAGADGQRGNMSFPRRFGGHNNVATNERSFFNGTQIAGPAVTNSDWDGSDGWPLVQLWDTHTHIVRVEDNVSKVEYRSNGDCLVPVMFVVDAE